MNDFRRVHAVQGQNVGLDVGDLRQGERMGGSEGRHLQRRGWPGRRGPLLDDPINVSRESDGIITEQAPGDGCQWRHHASLRTGIRIFVRANDANRGPAGVRGNHRRSLRIARLIQFNAEEAQPLTDACADERRVFADALVSHCPNRFKQRRDWRGSFHEAGSGEVSRIGFVIA